jgi:hypothetical protein
VPSRSWKFAPDLHGTPVPGGPKQSSRGWLASTSAPEGAVFLTAAEWPGRTGRQTTALDVASAFCLAGAVIAALGVGGSNREAAQLLGQHRFELMEAYRHFLPDR